MNIPPGLEAYVNDCHVHVFEIAWLPDEQINQFESDFGIVARYFSELRKNKNYVPDDTRTIQHVDEVLKLLAVMSGDHSYERILAPTGSKREVTTMCSVGQRLEEQGIKKGGRRNALNFKFPCARLDIYLLILQLLKCTFPRRNFKSILTEKFQNRSPARKQMFSFRSNYLGRIR